MIAKKELEQRYGDLLNSPQALRAEVELRFPGEYNLRGMAADELRTLIIGDDLGRRELIDNALGTQLNKLGRKIIDLADQVRIELSDVFQRRSPRPEDMPRVVCLCGSTRFAATFWDVGWELTLQGVLVLTLNVVRWCDDHAGEKLAPEVCDLLDELHFCKIDMADEIRVINLGGYIGESTSVEIAYAMYLGKPVIYLED